MKQQGTYRQDRKVRGEGKGEGQGRGESEGQEKGEGEGERETALAHKQRVMTPKGIWQATLEQSHIYLNTLIDTCSILKRLRNFCDSNKFLDNGNQSGSRAACDMEEGATGLKQKQ